MNLLWFLIVGLVAGWLAGVLVGGYLAPLALPPAVGSWEASSWRQSAQWCCSLSCAWSSAR